MTNTDHRATNLNEDYLTELRKHARINEGGRPVSPGAISDIKRWWSPDLRDWASAVAGFPISDPIRDRTIPSWVPYLLVRAHDREPDPPAPTQCAGREQTHRRAHEQREDQEREWERWNLMKKRQPVRVSVAFNFSRHTYAAHQHGAYHIVVWDELNVGRIRRHPGQALCQTWSKAKSLHLDEKSREAARQLADDDDRTSPTCKECLATAHRLAKGKSR